MSISELQPTDAQNVSLIEVRAVLERYKNTTDAEGLRVALGELGYIINNRRVTWSGGVGSCAVMRGGIMRVQVRAATWGYDYRPAMQRAGIYIGPRLEMGYKYAPCIEILPNGRGHYGNFYKTNARAKDPSKPQTPKPKKRLRRLLHM